MKKKIIKFLCVLLVFGCAYCLYMESHYSMTHVVKADLTEAEILAKMPDIAISEKDYALEEYVLSLPEVQEALEKAKESEYGADIPEEELDLTTLLNIVLSITIAVGHYHSARAGAGADCLRKEQEICHYEGHQRFLRPSRGGYRHTVPRPGHPNGDGGQGHLRPLRRG